MLNVSHHARGLWVFSGGPPIETFGPETFAGFLDKCRLGRTGPLLRLVEAYRDYLLLVADEELDPRVRCKVGASDLVQESLIEAQQKLAQFRGSTPEEFQAWLLQILRNNAIDTARRYRGSEKRRVDRERQMNSQSGSAIAHNQLIAADRSPRSEAIAREESESLMRALNRLRPEDRQAVVLRSWERLPFAEVGRRLGGRSAEAARKVWGRAVERLAGHLGCDESGDLT